MNEPLFKANVALSGVYDLEVRHWNDERTEYISTFYPGIKNKIVNQGLDMYGGITAYPGYPAAATGAIIVGTGNTPPAATDTKLQTPLALAAFNTSTWNSTNNPTAPYSTGTSSSTSFAVGAVVGNIAEIGLSFTNGGSTINDLVFSRALIQVGGSPGTITLTASDQLIVTYTLTATYAADTTGSIVVTTDGVAAPANNFTVRPYALGAPSGSSLYFANPFIAITAHDNYNGDMAFASSATTLQPATTSNPPGTLTRCDSLSAGAYTAGSYSLQFTMHWNTGHNFSVLMYFIQFNLMGFQMLFTNAFGPTSVQTQDFVVQISWSSVY